MYSDTVIFGGMEPPRWALDAASKFERYPDDDKHRKRGWLLTFPNGWKVSVIWNHPQGSNLNRAYSDHNTVEVAVFTPAGAYWGGDVIGWQTRDDVAAIIGDTIMKGQEHG